MLLLLPCAVEAVPGAGSSSRIVVKYRAPFDACGHCLVKNGVKFRTLTGTSSLDTLNQELGVKRAKAVFFEHHTTGRGRSGAWQAQVDRARRRFPERARRARFGAEAPDLSRVYVLELEPGTNPALAAAAYASDPDVEWAEPDRIVHTTFVPNDPLLHQQWGLATIGAAAAWDVTRGEGTVVAINDTGVDHLHPDLAPNMWTNPGEVPGNAVDDDGNGYVDDVHGWDFVAEDGDPFDQNGHGTHCAGIAAGAGNDARGIAGVAWGARIMSLRGLNANGAGGTSNLAAGIVYAVENGADVVSNSWGGYTGIEAVTRDAVLLADSLGAVVVAAAGNNADTTAGFGLAPYPTVITVGATMPGDVIAPFSSFGDEVSVSAPGSDVLSARASVLGSPGGHLSLSGTSMATPHVAGLAALLLSADPTLTPYDVRQAIETNAHPVPIAGFPGRWNPYFGWGRIDAARVFDPPQTFTRLTFPPGSTHAFADGVGDVTFDMRLGFTSLDPLSWTLTTPPWATPATTSGSGAAIIPVSFDLTGVSPGSLAGGVVVHAPNADDGGVTGTLAVTVHRDERTAPEALVASDTGSLTEDAPKIASNGLVTLAAWATPQRQPLTVDVARIGNDGAVVEAPPVYVSSPVPSLGVEIASDGRDFLAVWFELRTGPRYKILAQRIDSSGAPLDVTPMVVGEITTPTLYRLAPPQLAWDGTTYVVVWGEQTLTPPATTVRVRRIRNDGSMSLSWVIRDANRKPVFSQRITPRLACRAGQCLVAWHWSVDAFDEFGARLDELHGVRIEGDRPIEPPFRFLQGATDAPLLSADDGGYLAVVARPFFAVGTWVAAIRLSRGAFATHTTSRRVDTELLATTMSPVGVAFDGTDHVVTFRSRFGATGLFAARVRPDTTLVDPEVPGHLVTGRHGTGDGRVAAGWRDSVVVWRDRRQSGVYDKIFAQRMLAHTPPATPAPSPIGTIGPRSVAERGELVIVVSAPGLDPLATTFTATGLPSGADFDPVTRVFRFVPAADQAGVLPPVRFIASDGGQSAVEDVVVTVTEARLAFAGMLRDVDGQPLAGVSLAFRGARKTRRTYRSGADGSYRFHDLPPGNHRVKLDGTDKKLYRTRVPARARLLATDALGVDMIVERR